MIAWSPWLASILIAAVVLAWLRLLRQPRARGWRQWTLLMLQPLCALLLYLCLAPPLLPTAAGTLTLVTAGEHGGAGIDGEVVLALPDARAPGDARRVPDLATALRRHPGVRRLQVVGAGLDARDADAARGLPLEFVPPPLPRGVVELHLPERIAPGGRLHLAGRANGVDGGRAVLLDPAGEPVDQAPLDADGRFRLAATARDGGTVDFSLQLRDAGDGLVERLTVPLWVAPADAPRVLLVAGAANAETRQLRRWAADAGLAADTRVLVGGGVALGKPLPDDAAGFSAYDLVVLDGRAWAGLGPARREALARSLHAGTGVLLRVAASLPPTARSQLRELGLDFSQAPDVVPVQLGAPVDDVRALRALLGPGRDDTPFDPALAGEAPPALAWRALRVSFPDAAVLVRGPGGEALGYWRAVGQGRLGVLSVADSFRLVLAGRGDLHAELWSTVSGVLARATAGPAAMIHTAPPGERGVVCGLAGAASVLGPGGEVHELLVDPAAGADRCAGVWASSAGWHLLRTADGEQPFHVPAADEAPGITALRKRERTLRLAASAPVALASGTAGEPRPGPSWPWFLGLLAALSLSWWLERGLRHGRRESGAAPA